MGTHNSFAIYGRVFNPSALERCILARYNTIDGFAGDMRLTAKRVRSWLSGERCPSMDTVIRICDLLNCTVNAFAPKDCAERVERPVSVNYISATRTRSAINRHASPFKRSAYFQRGRD